MNIQDIIALPPEGKIPVIIHYHKEELSNTFTELYNLGFKCNDEPLDNVIRGTQRLLADTGPVGLSIDHLAKTIGYSRAGFYREREDRYYCIEIFDLDESGIKHTTLRTF